MLMSLFVLDAFEQKYFVWYWQWPIVIIMKLQLHRLRKYFKEDMCIERYLFACISL